MIRKTFNPKTFDTDKQRRYPKCPYCGHKDGDAWELDFGFSDEISTGCGNCGGDYRVTRTVHVTFATSAIPGGEPPQEPEGEDE